MRRTSLGYEFLRRSCQSCPLVSSVVCDKVARGLPRSVAKPPDRPVDRGVREIRCGFVRHFMWLATLS